MSSPMRKRALCLNVSSTLSNRVTSSSTTFTARKMLQVKPPDLKFSIVSSKSPAVPVKMENSNCNVRVSAASSNRGGIDVQGVVVKTEKDDEAGLRVSDSDDDNDIPANIKTEKIDDIVPSPSGILLCNPKLGMTRMTHDLTGSQPEVAVGAAPKQNRKRRSLKLTCKPELAPIRNKVDIDVEVGSRETRGKRYWTTTVPVVDESGVPKKRRNYHPDFYVLKKDKVELTRQPPIMMHPPHATTTLSPTTSPQPSPTPDYGAAALLLSLASSNPATTSSSSASTAAESATSSSPSTSLEPFISSLSTSESRISSSSASAEPSTSSSSASTTKLSQDSSTSSGYVSSLLGSEIEEYIYEEDDDYDEEDFEEESEDMDDQTITMPLPQMNGRLQRTQFVTTDLTSKAESRREKNRQKARRNRQKKKFELVQLHYQLRQSNEENYKLKQMVQGLTREVENMKHRELLSRSQNIHKLLEIKEQPGGGGGGGDATQQCQVETLLSAIRDLSKQLGECKQENRILRKQCRFINE